MPNPLDDARALAGAAAQLRLESGRAAAAVSSDMKTVSTNLRAAAQETQALSRAFSNDLGRAFENVVFGGAKLSETLRGLALDLAKSAFSSAMKPVQGFFGSILSGLIPGFATGGVVDAGRVQAFASGGIVGAPTLFGLSGGRMGLMGEAGPEAIMPLRRGPDGKLGVASAGGSSAPNITINISTPDVEGFRRSESQIASALARLSARGRRNM